MSVNQLSQINPVAKTMRDGKLFRQDEVPSFGWEAEVFEDVEARLYENSTFPCVFSKHAFKKGLILFHFVENNSDCSFDDLAKALSSYVAISREWDGTLLTAYPLLIAFSLQAISANRVEEYHSFGWGVLQRLHVRDLQVWPADVATDPNSSNWSMCFEGMPIFCNMSNPSHRRRRSRNLGRHFTIVVNPRERFDVFAGETPAGRKARANIRSRIEKYDDLPHAAQLASYGAGGLEWPQYGLPDDNNYSRIGRCPFSVFK